MKHARSYANVIRRWYRPVEHECLDCHRTLREAIALSRRTVITLQGVIKLNHAGYRCPDPQCGGRRRTYRSAAADALALPGFTFGVDIVLLVGRLHLGKHQTVDEVHQEVQDRLAPLGVTISRREILYLFEAYCTLLRATSRGQRGPAVARTGEEERGHHRLGSRHPARQGQRNDLPGARCTHGADPGSRERDLIGDGRDESALGPSGGVGSPGVGYDHGCAGE